MDIIFLRIFKYNIVKLHVAGEGGDSNIGPIINEITVTFY